MKKYLSLFLAVLFCFIFVACNNGSLIFDNGNSQDNTSNLEEDVIKIGVFEIQKGQNAIGSKQSILGIKYANHLKPKVMIGETEYKIKLVVAGVETDFDTESVRTAAQKLVDDNVKAVIGFFDQDLLKKCADIFEKENIPVICPNGCLLNVCQKYSNVFSLCTDEYKQSKIIADFVFNKIMTKKVLILSKLGDEVGQSQAIYFKEIFESLGGKTKSVTFENEIDLKSLKSNYKFIFAPLSQQDSLDLIEECEEHKIKASVLFNSNADNGVTLLKSQNKAFPVYVYSHFSLDGNSDFYLNFSEYISKDSDLTEMNGGNSAVSNTSALSFDAYTVLFDCFEKNGLNSDFSLIDSIKNIKLKGKTGNISFDSIGKRKSQKFIFKKSDNQNNIWYEIV